LEIGFGRARGTKPAVTVSGIFASSPTQTKFEITLYTRGVS